MKFRNLLIYLLILVMSIWVAYYSSAYYFGLQVKNNFIEKIARYNQPSKQLNINVIEYQQGILSSEAKISVSYNNLSPLLIKFKIVHQPIIYNNYIETKPKGFYLFNVLTQFTILTEFLDQKTDLFQHTILIDPEQDIKLQLTLDKIAYVFYRLLGFYSDDINYLDAYAELRLDNNSLNFEIKGQGKNLYSHDNLYLVDSSKFKIEYNLYLSPNDDSKNVETKYWKNKITFDISAMNIGTNPDSGYELLFSQPKLAIEFEGELDHLLEIIHGKNSLNDLLVADKHFNMVARLHNDSTRLLTPYKDQITLGDLFTQVQIENNNISRVVNGSFKLDNLNLRSITDNLSTNNINVLFKVDVADQLIEQFIELSGNKSSDVSEDRYHSSLIDLTKVLLDNYNLVSVNSSLELNNLAGTGLILGKLSADKFKLDFDSSKESSSQDQIASLKFLADKFLWQMSDANFRINIQDLNLNFNSLLNLSEYMDTITASKDTAYNTNVKLILNTPKFELSLPEFNFSIDGMQANSDFELNKDITGHLNNIFNIDKFQLKVDGFTADIDNLKSKSSMQQVYKFILAGINTITTNKSDFKYKDNQLSINNFKYDSKSKLANENLEYFNDLDVQAVQINKNKIGDVSLKNRFYDISLNDYEELMVQLNSLSLNKEYTENLTSNEINNEILNSIINFLDKGLSIDNTLYMGIRNGDNNLRQVTQDSSSQAKLNNNDEYKKAIKFYNKLRFKDQSHALSNIQSKQLTQGSVSNTDISFVNDIVAKSELEFVIDVSRQYIEELIDVIKNQDINNLYKNLQYVGVLKYTDDIARLDVEYKHPDIFINGKSLDYWRQQLKSRNNREDYFDKLQQN